jgi:hypothetical protein
MNELNDFKIRLQRGHWGSGYDVILAKPNSENHISIVSNVEIESVGVDRIIDPLLSLTKNNAQLLMDDLWEAGIRPTEGTGSAGALKATQDHLTDMRKIVFSQLKMYVK